MSVLREGRDYVWVKARCCREWTVAFPGRVGKCGECGETPELDWASVADALARMKGKVSA